MVHVFAFDNRESNSRRRQIVRYCHVRNVQQALVCYVEYTSYEDLCYQLNALRAGVINVEKFFLVCHGGNGFISFPNEKFCKIETLLCDAHSFFYAAGTVPIFDEDSWVMCDMSRAMKYYSGDREFVRTFGPRNRNQGAIVLRYDTPKRGIEYCTVTLNLPSDIHTGLLPEFLDLPDWWNFVASRFKNVVGYVNQFGVFVRK